MEDGGASECHEDSLCLHEHYGIASYLQAFTEPDDSFEKLVLLLVGVLLPLLGLRSLFIAKSTNERNSCEK